MNHYFYWEANQIINKEYIFWPRCSGNVPLSRCIDIRCCTLCRRRTSWKSERSPGLAARAVWINCQKISTRLKEFIEIQFKRSFLLPSMIEGPLREGLHSSLTIVALNKFQQNQINFPEHFSCNVWALQFNTENLQVFWEQWTRSMIWMSFFHSEISSLTVLKTALYKFRRQENYQFSLKTIINKCFIGIQKESW